jgi:hypothetical protein
MHRSTVRRLRALAGVTLLALALPVSARAQPVDCGRLDLETVRARLVAAEVAALTGDRDALTEAVTAARDELDGILAACPSVDGSPEPVELGAEVRMDTFRLEVPRTMVRIEEGLLQDVPGSGGAPGAETVTYADSRASADALRAGPPTEPVPVSTQVLSVGVGSPTLILATLGLFDATDPAPTTVETALRTVATRVVEETADTSAPVQAGEVEPFTFEDGTPGARLGVTWVDADGAPLAAGWLLLRGPSDSRWAIGVTLGSPLATDALAALGRASLATVELG